MAHLLPAVRGVSWMDPKRRRLAWLVPAVLAALVVVAAVVWVRQLLGPDGATGVPDGSTPIVAGAVVTSPEAKQAGITAATEATLKILSYDSSSLEEDIRAAKAELSGDMLEQYSATMADIRRQTERNGAKVEATVAAASIISATEHDAKVLLFVNQRTTGKHLDEPRIDRNRVVVTVHRDGGDWSVTRLDAL